MKDSDIVPDEDEILFGFKDGGMRWTGSIITGLTVHRRAKPGWRLDVTPFLVLYGVWVYLVATSGREIGIPGIGLSRKLDLFWAMFGFVVLVLIHALVLLGQHWSVRFRVAVGYFRIANVERDLKDLVKLDDVRVLVIPAPHKGHAELVRLHRSKEPDMRFFFMFQKRNYVLDERETNLFRKIRYPVKLPLQSYLEHARKTGATSTEDMDRNLRRFGANFLEIPMPEFWELYKDSLLSPFFVFQVFCIGLWALDDYWMYAVMTLALMMFSEAVVVKGRMRTLQELRGMRTKARRVHVYRDRKWSVISTVELVPGDIFSLTRGDTEGDAVPCDALLLSGSVVVNEAILTGESVPLIKEGVELSEVESKTTRVDITGLHKGNTVFSGTTVLTHSSGPTSDATPQAKPPDNGCIAFVLRTGFGSSQGKLMKTIMYSSQRGTGNSRDPALLILFLLCFAIVSAGYVLHHGMVTQNQSRYKLLIHCIMIVTAVVPPEIPMQLSLTVNSALLTLYRDGVFCTEPFRIPLGGKVDVCCFDKTGTLTTDQIKAVGIVSKNELTRSIAADDKAALGAAAEAPLDAQLVLAGCHALVHVDNSLIGDPLEIEALQAVQWAFTKSGDSAVPKKSNKHNAGIRILYRNRFVSSLQRMSVVARIEMNNSEVAPRVLVKGSAEAIRGLLTGEVPNGYDEIAASLSRRGLRVLALAYRELDKDSALLRPSRREDVEKDLTFAGFVAFECPLRKDSRRIVKELIYSSHRVCMITGDATLTAVHVGRQVGILSAPTLILENRGENLEWISAANGRVHEEFRADGIRNLRKSYSLCVSRASLDSAASRDKSVWQHLECFSIFARMSPDAKERVLLVLRDRGFHTMMCGDGTNDVGALKQSHVGVALLSSNNQPPATDISSPVNNNAARRVSRAAPKIKTLSASVVTKLGGGSQKHSRSAQNSSSGTGPAGAEDPVAEMRQKIQELQQALDEDSNVLVKLGDASIASPFTSRTMSIEACVKIIRQGRCTLATTLTMYQILALQSLISAYTLSVLYLDGIKFGDRQMTLVSLSMTAAFFMISRSKALKDLSKERPANSIFSPRMFMSLCLQFAVHLISTIYCVKIAKQWLPEDVEVDIEGDFKPNILNTVVSLVSSAQQVSVFLTNFRGRPFMAGLLENVALRRVLTFVLGIIFICTSGLVPDLNNLLQLTPWPSNELKQKITLVIIGDLIGAFLVDRILHWIFPPKILELEN
eukprot:CAMPEP_0184686556 /NCGR_PEP_ID=MMETSP0312-20130426/22945_1 /TAXON_ID=31354 /ORGANISM="Compsopogon coeruleus, Strain SAG 36.94" /LENGTH=1231 /DNA_ID=CAMNT_0027141763 /DNA_START=58 /DNA_END=3753 /DNA_ORIENTATION=-